jgi:hypothetical protein
MQGQYPGNRGVRPPVPFPGGHDEAVSARLFLCAGCRIQVVVCRCCDRGQVYCADGCARKARHATLRRAGERYQNALIGRRHHAARQHRYRVRHEKVTHHGSLPSPAGDLLPPGSPNTASDVAASHDRPHRSITRCHWCGQRCAGVVRQGFLRRRGRRRELLSPNTQTEDPPW